MPFAPRSTQGIRGAPVGKAVFCLALNLAVLSVRQTWCQEPTVFAGQVRSSNGHIIRSGVKVSLESLQDVPIQTQPANSDGQFEFRDLFQEYYHLRVSAQGFQTLQQNLDLGPSGGRFFVNLFLTPVDQSQNAEAAPAVLTDQKAPEKARDELAKGVQALSKEKYSDARTHFEKAIAVYPCYARAQTELAIVLIPSGDFTQAESALRKSIQCDSGYHHARLVLGQLLNMQKRFGESEKTLREAIRLAPSSWELYYQLGVADFGLGEYARAAEEFEEVLSFNSAPPSSYYARAADAYLAQKTYDKAYAKMQDYLRIDPQGRFAEKIRTTIQEMEAKGVLTRSTENAAQTEKE